MAQLSEQLRDNLNSDKFNARQQFIQMLQKNDLNDIITCSNSVTKDAK